MTVVRIRQVGMKDLSKAIDALTSVKVRSRILRKAGKVSMAPVLAAAKSNAPSLKLDNNSPNATANILRNDIKMSTRVNVSPKIRKNKITKNSEHELSVMVKTGKSSEDFAMVSEFGRERFVITRKVAFGKPTKEYLTISPELEPNPWIRPALYKNSGNVFNLFRTTLREELGKEAKRVSGRIKKFNKKLNSRTSIGGVR